jgi:hypothetical protein
MLGKHFDDCPIEPSIKTVRRRAQIAIASTDRKQQSAVVVVIVRKQAFRVNGQVRTTVMSVANKSVALDLSIQKQISKACVFPYASRGFLHFSGLHQ